MAEADTSSRSERASVRRCSATSSTGCRTRCATGIRSPMASCMDAQAARRSSWPARRTCARARHQAHRRRRARAHQSRRYRASLRHPLRYHHLSRHRRRGELMADSPFLQSVERRRPGSSMRNYVTRTLPHSSAVVVSNRAPHEPRPEGGFARGAGGVVTALLTFAEVAGAEWVACARTEGERALIEEHGTTWDAPLIRSETRLHYVTPTPEQYDQYYSVISNPVLWFVQHYLWDLAHQPVINGRIHRAWKNGYVEVNKQIARKVVDVARGLQGRPLVMIHDYQLYLVPRLVRDQLHGAIIQHFVHIPWPTPQYWKVLPREMRDAIVIGLLGCDIVGFQTSLDVRNFLMTCEENLGLAVDERERAVLIDGRVVYARAYPISIDIAGTTRLSYSHGVMVEERKLRDWRPEHLIVRIDRTDPSKNIVRGFLAYEKLLAHHPELKGRVQFWAFLQPSRQDVALYRDYLRLIRSTAHRI